MDRSFACSKADLDRYLVAYNKLKTTSGRTNSEMTFHALSHYVSQLQVWNITGDWNFVKIKEIEPDVVTKFWIAKAVASADPIDLHYALHHVIWQLVDSHEKGLLVLSQDRYQILKVLTSDCIVAERNAA